MVARGTSRQKQPFGALARSLILALTLAACGSTSGRVDGVVVAGPACPGASGLTSPGCAPMPLSGVPLTVVRVSDESVPSGMPTAATGSTVARPMTDAGGAFSVQLDPGRYYVIAPGMNGLTAPGPFFFDLSAGSIQDLTIAYDAGSR